MPKWIAEFAKLCVGVTQGVTCLVMFALMSYCSGCYDKETAPASVFTTVVFEGYKTPGRIEQAKEMGFKDCELSYGGSEFLCKHVGAPSLLGVKADSATLRLEYEDQFKPYIYPREIINKEQRTADKLTYKEISFEFPSTEYDDRCIRKMDKDPRSEPIECRKNNAGMNYLRHMLTEAGWLQEIKYKNDYYLKENELISLEFVNNSHTVRLNPIFPEERDSAIQKIKLNIQKINQEKAEQAKQEAILKKLRD